MICIGLGEQRAGFDFDGLHGIRAGGEAGRSIV